MRQYLYGQLYVKFGCNLSLGRGIELLCPPLAFFWGNQIITVLFQIASIIYLYIYISMYITIDLSFYTYSGPQNIQVPRRLQKSIFYKLKHIM